LSECFDQRRSHAAELGVSERQQPLDCARAGTALDPFRLVLQVTYHPFPIRMLHGIVVDSYEVGSWTRLGLVKTFIVGYQGVVYQKDLGPDTLKIFKEMELYNPDKTWTPTSDSWPPDDLEDFSTSEAKD
jgi:hypothetical protein